MKAARLPAGAPKLVIARRVDSAVLSPERTPVAGALVSVIDLDSYRGMEFSVSGGDGKFSIGLPAAGSVVTVTANGYVAGVFDPGKIGNAGSIVLSRPSKVTRAFSGSVVDTKGMPLAKVRVRLMSWTWPVGAAFYASTREDGRFEFLVDSSEASSYDMLVDDPRYVSNFSVLKQPNDDNVRLIAYERAWIDGEASRVDESALRDSCISLTGDGPAKFAASLSAARVVGLGESTHGTREYTELRGRVIEELARDGWLTTIALEGSWQEVSHIDDYVRRGKGTARDAVKALTSWPWRTEEFVVFVETVRKLNDALPADKKIEFVGIDYAPPSESAEFIGRYFEDRKSTYAAELADLDPLVHATSWGELSKVSAADLARASSALAKLKQADDMSSPNALVTALALQVTQQLVETPEEDARDRVMAEAVLALLARSDRPRHVAIWAHNGHLAAGPIEGAIPMGQYLKERLHGEYRAIGSIFYDGAFLTYSRQDKMVNHVVAPPPPFYLESTMHRASPSHACILDIAEASRRSSVRDWISVPKYVRIYGGVEISESYPFAPVVLPDLWSAMMFVPSSTPTTPLDLPN